MKREVVRKAIHFLGLLYIPSYIFLGRNITLAAVVALTALSALIEALRLFGKLCIPSLLLRDHERNRPAAYLYFGIAMSVVTAIFPEDACFSAIVCGIVGDGVAGIAKRAESLRKLSHLLMFAISFLALYLLTLKPFPSAVATVVAVVAERYPRIGKIYVDDNLSIPLLSSLSFWLFSSISLLVVQIYLDIS